MQASAAQLSLVATEPRRVGQHCPNTRIVGVVLALIRPYVTMAWRERVHRVAGLLEETRADYEMSTQWEHKKQVKRVSADSATEAGKKASESVRSKSGGAEVDIAMCEVRESKAGPRVAHLERSGWKDG